MPPSAFYKAYLKSDRWKKKREQVFRHYGKRCYACRTAKRVMNVHHLSYEHLSREPLTDLMVLCPECHSMVTKYHRRHRRQGLRRNTYIVVNIIRSRRVRGVDR